MMHKYKTLKVFDNGDMPSKVRSAFFDQNEGKGNSIYVSKYVYDEGYPIKIIGKTEYDDVLESYKPEDIVDTYEIGGYRYAYLKGKDIVSDWLYENGAKISEMVLIKHSW